MKHGEKHILYSPGSLLGVNAPKLILLHCLPLKSITKKQLNKVMMIIIATMIASTMNYSDGTVVQMHILVMNNQQQ